ncbi:unnamed protein product [Paramecium primaurelia]|uniref:NET domain-containing protein n=2 Tax=Paramecium TaxID=5884 RepID=A0A8S1V5Q7_9CILI|nr:unnamed protein product [Paramecium primaurelia]CAD8170086.1 unnamed protein product [Paramecium pentaurelia]
MASQLEFNLNQIQVDFILSKMPKGYSLLQSNLLKSREQRVPKKVNKYDASFQSNKQEVVEDKSKRSQRIVPIQKEQVKIPLDDNCKKGLQLLQKFKSHPAFNEINASGYLNIDKIEASFKQEGNLMNLWNQIRIALQKLTQSVSSTQMQDQVTLLENHFYHVFKPIQNEQKQISTSTKNIPITNKVISNKVKEPQSQKKQDTHISFEEKRQLGQHIRELPKEHLKGVWEIVQQSVQNQEAEELEFDIDQLPAKVIRKLQEFVQSKLKTKKVKVDPSINYSSQKSNNQEDSSFPSESSD